MNEHLPWGRGVREIGRGELERGILVLKESLQSSDIIINYQSWKEFQE